MIARNSGIRKNQKCFSSQQVLRSSLLILKAPSEPLDGSLNKSTIDTRYEVLRGDAIGLGVSTTIGEEDGAAEEGTATRRREVERDEDKATSRESSVWSDESLSWSSSSTSANDEDGKTLLDESPTVDPE